MDEYERAANELHLLLGEVSDGAFVLVRDTETADEDCRSIQTVMAHVVGAGFGYAGMLRKAWGIERSAPKRELASRRAAQRGLDEMLEYTCATLDGRWQISETDAEALRIQSPWGPVYDLEQLLEHAIVHVLRHRRQIERFLDR